MSTVGQLTDRPKAALATLAKRRGIRGWESMNKGDLLKALARGAGPAKSKPAKTAKPAKSTRPARVTVKAAAKITAKRPAKRAAKPAAKIARPVKSGAAKSIANGLHRTSTISNGSSKTATKPAAGKLDAAKPSAAKPAGTPAT